MNSAPAGPPARVSSHEAILLGVILSAGAALRVAYLLELLHWRYAREVLLVGDGRVYHEAALRILSGNPWGVPVSYQDPLYPTILALLVKFTGSDLAGPLAVQHALGVASAGLCFAIARRMGGPVAGLVAAALAALSPVPIYYEGLIEKSAPGIFLFALATWLLASGLARGRAARVAGAGAALALTALLRGNALFVLPVAGLAIALARPRPIPTGKAIVALGLGIALVLVPTMTRNRMITGSFALTAGQGGANFWVGNNAGNRTGTFRPPPFLREDPRHEEYDWRAEAERWAGRTLDRGEVSRFWLREGLRYWVEFPAAAMRNTGIKMLLFFSGYELPDTQAYSFFRDYIGIPILRWPLPAMGPTMALAILGLLVSLPLWRARAAELGLLAGYAASVVFFFVLGRYRIIALVPAASFAGVGAAAIVRHARRREALRFAAAVAVLVAAGFVTRLGRWPAREALSYINLAVSLAREGRYDEAARPVAEWLAYNPQSVLARELEGKLAMIRGDLETAERDFSGALALAPQKRSLRVAMARLRLRQGRREEAIAIMEALVRDRPYDTDLRRMLQGLRASGPGR